jgi:hypothetical protein
MIRRPPNDTDDINGAQLRALLKRYDPTTQSGPATLAMLENRILAQIDALPEPGIFGDIPLSPWIMSKKWALRGACAASVLFVILGFIVGQGIGGRSFQSTATPEIVASADDTAWQSFISNPASAGEIDDASE